MLLGKKNRIISVITKGVVKKNNKKTNKQTKQKTQPKANKITSQKEKQN